MTPRIILSIILSLVTILLIPFGYKAMVTGITPVFSIMLLIFTAGVMLANILIIRQLRSLLLFCVFLVCFMIAGGLASTYQNETDTMLQHTIHE